MRAELSPPYFLFIAGHHDAPDRVWHLIPQARAYVISYIKSAYPHLLNYISFSEGSFTDIKRYGLLISIDAPSYKNSIRMLFDNIPTSKSIGITFKTDHGQIPAGSLAHDLQTFTPQLLAAFIILILSTMDLPDAPQT